MLSRADDEALAMRAAGGDVRALDVLMERHYDRIFRIGYRLLGARFEAEDLTQDVCLTLAHRVQSYRGDAKFTTWLYRVVLNGARDRQRAGARRARLAEDHAELEDLRRGADAARKADAEWLREALMRLPPDLRETTVLVLDEELTHAEAAEVLGLKEGTISWRMAEARRALKLMAEAERRPAEDLET